MLFYDFLCLMNSVDSWLSHRLIITFKKSIIDIGSVTPQFLGVPLTSRQHAKDSTLGHRVPKSWYRTGTICLWTSSYSAPP